jgi:hypothetical protein
MYNPIATQSRVTGPWDHKVSVSAKKVKKKLHACVPFKVGIYQRWYFRKLMANGSVFLGIDCLQGIDSAMELIPLNNRFLAGIDYV